jgi:hypothetical protein
MLAIDLRENE